MPLFLFPKNSVQKKTLFQNNVDVFTGLPPSLFQEDKDPLTGASFPQDSHEDKKNNTKEDARQQRRDGTQKPHFDENAKNVFL